ncbi:MAG: tripartite tricarboxylate transporter substrate binding protein [Betaproteobacteria bacterium]|nr:tripartite tricarboxylate transporter substrate binding protein [Betaproteobacteria bacterium]
MKTHRMLSGSCLQKVTFALCLLTYALGAGAQAYPVRPVRVVIPYAPGGSSDTTARVLGEKLRELLGQQFVIDNRPGASGSIGRDLVAKATPDGYTLLVGDSPHTINVHVLKHVPYDPIRDFTPITLLATAPQVLIVNPAFSAKTAKEFVALARAQPGKLNYGSGGSGSVTHMTGELFKLAAGVNIVHVPYKSIALANADVIAGQIQAAFPTAPGIVGHVRAGRLRALAVSTLKRARAFPDVPTFEESGVPGMTVSNWFGVFAPAGLPKPILAKLHKTIMDAMQAPDVRARFSKLSLDISTTTPEQFGAHLRSELARWGKVVKAAGIRAE